MRDEDISKEMGWWNPGGIALDNFNGFDAYPERTEKVKELIRKSQLDLLGRLEDSLIQASFTANQYERDMVITDDVLKTITRERKLIEKGE